MKTSSKQAHALNILHHLIYLLFSRLGLFFPLLAWGELNHEHPKLAEKLFHEKLYRDALPFFLHLFDVEKDNNFKAQWAIRLAACHLEDNHPQEALALLSSFDASLFRNQALYLMSLAHRQLKQFPEALDLLQQCSFQHSKKLRNLVALERGYHHMQMGDFANAQQLFSSISSQGGDAIDYECAQLQLAKLFLIEHRYRESQQILHSLSHQICKGTPLDIVRIYLTGWTSLGLEMENEAALHFETLLPKALGANGKWTTNLLHCLISIYLKQAMKTEESNRLSVLFSKAEDLLNELIKRAPNETSPLVLTDFYLIKSRMLSDPEAFAKAEQLLNRSECLFSADQLKEVLLRRAATAPSYEQRNQSYQQLLDSLNEPLDFTADLLFSKGLNDFKEAVTTMKSSMVTAFELFDVAIREFIQVIQIEKRPPKLAQAYKYLILAHIHTCDHSHLKAAAKMLDELMATPSLLETMESQEEICCLFVWIALSLNDQERLNQAQSLLQIPPSSHSHWQERYIKLEGFLSLHLQDWKRADSLFHLLLEEKAYASSHSEALFWCGYCAGQQNQEALKRDYFQQAFNFERESSYAPLAYFYFYSYREYLLGERKTIKHLQAMPQLFPNHQLSISAFYLIGLYQKKDFFSEEGEIIKRKDLTAAIDAFQAAESIFERLFEQKHFSPVDLKYFVKVRYQCQLERAQLNLAIAKQSKGGKKKIYLEYGEEVFKQLIQDFTTPNVLAKDLMICCNSPYPKMWADAELGLASLYEEKNDWKEAEITLNHSLEHYHQAQIFRGYGVMRAWYAKGKLAQHQKEFKEALHHFLEGEKAAEGAISLSPSEKLDLWIQQSICYKELNQLDQAMTILSKVINQDVISPLRIKAMFLRAEIYQLQGRPELAIKQLEAVAQKGGEWAQYAIEKLEKIHGY
ncbi:MAG: tetratricopeptide repeat protein [Parachlamydiaceae bacterium]